MKMSCLRRIGTDRTETVALSGRMCLVGRSRESDIIIDDPAVADVALRLWFSGGHYQFDAIAKTVLQVNGRRARSGVLHPGDRLELAGHVFVFDNSPEPCENTDLDPKILESFSRLSEAIADERNLSELLAKFMKTALETLGGTDAFIFKIDKEGKPEVFVSTGVAHSQERFSDTIIQEVLRTTEGVLIPNALSDPTFGSSRSVADLKLRSVICTPIKSAGKVLGVIYIGSHNAAVSFTELSLRVLKIYAMLIGTLVNHVDFIGEQNRRIEHLEKTIGTDGLIAASKPMQDVIRAVESVAQSDITVLFQGETGTGKNVIAQLLHSKSSRVAKPLIVVNCSSLRSELLESELFGHRRGSFTGAIDDQLGLFEAARGGSLLLDEIGELELPLQAKLLRTLETGRIRPVGMSSEKTVDVRVICATNRDLRKMVSDGAFRADLFYRINQFAITVPPLRDRGEDVALLAYHFLEKLRIQYPSRDIFDYHPESLDLIRSYAWPGNVRELANTIHKGVLTAQGPLIRLDLKNTARQSIPNFEEATRTFQRNLLRMAVELAGGNKEDAAKALGLSRSTFFRYQASLEQP